MKNQSFSSLMHDSLSYRRTFWSVTLSPVAALICAIVAVCNKDLIFDVFPDCTLYTLTGLNCLSCGCTRATFAILRGDILTAIYYNPVYVVFLCWLVYLYIRLVVSLVRRPYKAYVLNTKLWQGVTIAVVLAVFLILRNTPVYRSVFY